MQALILQRLKRLHSDESGQVLWIFVISGLALVVLAALVFNTGKQATRRMEMQNAVDASAVSGAMWVARGMNVISMDNVAMTETLGLIANLRAIKQAIPINEELLVVWDGIGSALMSNPFTFAAGVFVKISVFVGRLDTMAIKFFCNFVCPLAEPTRGLLWQFMKALSGFSGIVADISYPLGALQSYNVGRQNIRDFQSSATELNADDVAILLPNLKTKFKLPAEAGDFQELCPPTHYGTNSSSPVDTHGYTPFLGYPFGKGPFEKYKDWATKMWSPSFITLIPWWYGGVADWNLEVFCHGGDIPPPPSIPKKTRDLAEAKRSGAKEFVWVHSWVSTGTIERDSTDPPPANINFEPVNSSPTGQYSQQALQLLNSGMTADQMQDDILRHAQKEAADNKPVFQAPVDPQTYGSETLTKDASFQPPGKQIKNWVWTTTSTKSEPNKEQPPPGSPGKTIYVVTEDRYTFQYATINKSYDKELKEGAQAGNPSEYPQPYHFAVDGQKLTDKSQLPQAIQSLQYLAVAHLTDDKQPWLGRLKVSIRGQSRPVFSNPNPLGLLTYAQVQVYNPTSWDLYTQDWRVKLVPATLLEQYLDGDSLGGSLVLSGMGTIMKELNAH